MACGLQCRSAAGRKGAPPTKLGLLFYHPGSDRRKPMTLCMADNACWPHPLTPIDPTDELQTRPATASVQPWKPAVDSCSDVVPHRKSRWWKPPAAHALTTFPAGPPSRRRPPPDWHWQFAPRAHHHQSPPLVVSHRTAPLSSARYVYYTSPAPHPPAGSGDTARPAACPASKPAAPTNSIPSRPSRRLPPRVLMTAVDTAPNVSTA